MKKFELAFIGAGNMAEALVKGIVKSGACAAESITVTDTRPERLDFFRSTFSVKATSSNKDAAKSADVLFLSVKPQVMYEVLADLAGALKPTVLIVSIAAGIRTSTLENGLGGGVRVVRVMPNTPALVGAGASALCRGRHALEDDLLTAEKLMGAVGMVVRVEEDDMDAVTALSGSGPAYVFFLMEIMLEAAQRMGLAREAAKGLAYATIAGSAKLAQESSDAPGVLRERVTSKGGTTAAALESLKQRGVFEAFVEAIEAAQRRSKELSKG